MIPWVTKHFICLSSPWFAISLRVEAASQGWKRTELRKLAEFLAGQNIEWALTFFLSILLLPQIAFLFVLYSISVVCPSVFYVTLLSSQSCWSIVLINNELLAMKNSPEWYCKKTCFLLFRKKQTTGWELTVGVVTRSKWIVNFDHSLVKLLSCCKLYDPSDSSFKWKARKRQIRETSTFSLHSHKPLTALGTVQLIFFPHYFKSIYPDIRYCCCGKMQSLSQEEKLPVLPNVHLLYKHFTKLKRGQPPCIFIHRSAIELPVCVRF